MKKIWLNENSFVEIKDIDDNKNIEEKKDNFDIDLRDKRLSIMFKFLWFFSSLFLFGVYYFNDIKNNIVNFENLYFNCYISSMIFGFSIPIIFFILFYIVDEIKFFKIFNNFSIVEKEKVELIYENICINIRNGIYISFICICCFLILKNNLYEWFLVLDIFLFYLFGILLFLLFIFRVFNIKVKFINKIKFEKIYNFLLFLFLYIFISIFFLYNYNLMNVEYKNTITSLSNVCPVNFNV